MSSTTLITFLVRAPSNVRSVDLVGSWDNFSRPYAMERDRRMGAGHWRGCHTFTDIVRDGTSPSQSPGRSGGLKMGGTYWYYYRLDGDAEFYNEVEPVTSLCPLLPGQPVNVLNVPIILPDTDHLHRRDNSISSVKSDQRTMDPKDKFMNPRTPPKPRPGLPRLKTSPEFYQQAAPSSSSFFNLSNSNDNRSPMSQPASSTHSPMFRLAPKVKVARSVSPPRSRGLRAAFLNIAGTRSPGVDHSDDYINNYNNNAYHDPQPVVRTERSNSPMRPPVPISIPSSNNSSKVASPMGSPIELDGMETRKLPFRHPQVDHEQTRGPPSIRVRRASKSSRDNTPLPELSLLGSSSSPSSTKTELSGFSRPPRLETLEEALSQRTTPMVLDPQKLSTTPSPISTPVLFHLREKRLPTLPNSPSSVMDAELRAIDAQYRPIDMELLRSHFSDDTSGIASTLYNSESQSPQEKSRFSEWSTDTELVSPASMTSSSTFNADHLSHSSPLLNHSHHTANNDNTGNAEYDRALEAPLPSISVSGPTTPVLSSEPEIILSPIELTSDSPLLPSTAAVTSPIDLEFSSINFEECDYDNRTDSFHVSDPKRQGAILPFLRVVTPLSVSAHQTEHQLKRSSEDYTVQSAAMKELMEEIGYLGDMISSGL
ncbi:hypothetical protein UA08_01051 [Talaromyces atroroseus]|uniref:AMP-activated protein kinase glycogen-binding domain-containing protein n=1 Tax=Talaromyces atroroseus TaxID=1441469 RepID=A0A225AUQ2_TALAT|nr:hypothetical protein UA08_01051 [Talaromyces atroroseus]OKL64680.1 hypothetical protein UA08_01051 [Talaromyces atroroseus]